MELLNAVAKNLKTASRRSYAVTTNGADSGTRMGHLVKIGGQVVNVVGINRDVV